MSFVFAEALVAFFCLIITCYCRSSKGKCLGPFDTDGDGMLSRGEFSELCYELFVGTGDEVNYGVYEFDPDAIFGRIAGIMPRRWSDRRRVRGGREVVASLEGNLSKVDRSPNPPRRARP